MAARSFLAAMIAKATQTETATKPTLTPPRVNHQLIQSSSTTLEPLPVPLSVTLAHVHPLGRRLVCDTCLRGM